MIKDCVVPKVQGITGMMKRNRQAQARYTAELCHRINAGRAALKAQVGFFSRQFGEVSSEWKADDTRVTFADFAISEQFVMALRRDFPGDDFCSEEASPLDETVNLESSFAWVVDPIDGTNNYVLGFPVCAISLALLYEGEPVYGFIYEHATGSILEGGPGQGLIRNGKKINRDTLAKEAQVMLGMHFPMEAEPLRALEPLMSLYRVRCFGSAALTLAYVATGYLSGAVDYRVKVWDVAAAYAMCLAVDLEIKFIGKSPFPLKHFNPQMDNCPYYSGSAELMESISACMATLEK